MIILKIFKYILIAAVVAYFLRRRDQKKKRRLAAKECAYGSAQMATIIEANDIAAFKALFSSLKTTDERYFYSISASRSLIENC